LIPILAVLYVEGYVAGRRMRKEQKGKRTELTLQQFTWSERAGRVGFWRFWGLRGEGRKGT
jgi:hypothetical protein